MSIGIFTTIIFTLLVLFAALLLILLSVASYKAIELLKTMLDSTKQQNNAYSSPQSSSEHFKILQKKEYQTEEKKTVDQMDKEIEELNL